MFKINVVDGGDLAARALIYQQPKPYLMEYLNNNMSNVISAVKNYSQQFMSNIKALKEKYYGDESIVAAKLILNQTGDHFGQNTIYTVYPEQFHNANFIMQRFIMEHPIIRQKHVKNMCHGYQETYMDPEPDIKNYKERQLYNMVMNGIVQFEPDTGDGYITYHSHSQDDLHMIDQVSIMDTWDNITNIILEGKDPTDPDYNSF